MNYPLTYLIRLVFFLISMVSLWLSQDESIPLSWALFLCFVAGVSLIGVFLWEETDDAPKSKP